MRPGADFRRFSGVNAIPDRLWDDKILARDARGFTVLSVDRFRGPRLNDQLGTHAYWELVAVLSGSGELTGPARQALRRPDVLLIPPGTVHGERAVDQFDTVWVAVAGSRLRDLGAGVLTVRDEDLCRLAEELWMQATVRTDRSGSELDGLALAMLGRFLRLSGSGKLRTRSSPKAFLNTLRIERAAHLLRHTALPVVRIAALVGFDDPLYFSRVFTRTAGVAPSRFR